MSGGAVAHGPTTDGCRYCWMCRHVCPTGFATKQETHTPHGYALLIASTSRGVTTWDAETVDALYHCADCGCCESHCATHQPLPEAIVGARAGLASAGLAPAAAIEVRARLERWGSVHGDPGRRPAQATGPIGLFVGDAAPEGQGATVEAALRLLARAGFEAVPVGVARSTGLVASGLGFVDTAKTLAAAVLADVAASGCRQLLVLGPGDKFAFERAYASRLGVSWPEGVLVREATAALAEAHASGALRLQPSADARAWAYQEPDHAVRVGARPWPRQLLSAALGADGERRPLRRDERAHPCGVAGGLDLTQPDLSRTLAEMRVDEACAAGAARLVTEDPACVRHLRRHAAGRIEVVDLFELLAASR
ncbi:MAG: (Fe-S)-binding protein [Vicinamibacteraceae bacterium]